MKKEPETLQDSAEIALFQKEETVDGPPHPTPTIASAEHSESTIRLYGMLTAILAPR